MPNYKIHYFNVYGRAEPARMMFALTGTQFEDHRFTFEEWEAGLNKSPLFPFGQGPVLEVDGKLLAQSNAIYRYLGTKLGFYGNTDFDRAVVDSICDYFQDFFDEIRPFYAVCCGYWEGDREQLSKTVMEPVRERHLNLLTKFIEENETKSGYLVGNTITFGDLLLFSHVLIYEHIVDGYADQFPTIIAHRNKIREIPAMKKYLENRPYSYQ